MTMNLRNPKSAAWLFVILFAVLASVPFLIPGTGFLAVLSFAPLFLLEHTIRTGGLRRGWWYGFAAFLLFNIATTWWVWNVSPAGAIAALTANTIQMSVIFALLRLTRSWAIKAAEAFPRRAGVLNALPYVFFIALWLGWEHCYCEVELSWPWLILGHALATAPRLAQWYEVTGPLGGSLWILAGGLLVFAAIRAAAEHRAKALRAFGIAASCFILVPALLSLIRYHSWQENGEPVEVLAVQPNVDPFMKYGIVPQARLDEQLLSQAEGALTPDTRYLITPETFTYSIDIDHPYNSPSWQAYSAFLAKRPELTMVLGSRTIRQLPAGPRPSRTARQTPSGWYEVYNSAIMAGVNAPYVYYHKAKLVPGVESMPRIISVFAPIIEYFGGAATGHGRMDRIVALQGADGHRFGVMICYDSAYGDFSSQAAADGADLLAVITNDGWWGDTPGYRQHFRLASLRAIENRRDVVQCANTGMSGFINQRGDVLSHTGWWTSETLLGVMHARSDVTFFSRHGDIIGRTSSVLGPILLLLLVLIPLWGKRCGCGRSASKNA